MTDMATIRTFPIVCLLALLASGHVARAENPIVQHLNFRIAPDGSADVEVNMKFNAAQWVQYSQNAKAQGLAVRKREMERMMAAYLLEDFKYEEDELQRSASFRFRLYGICEYTGNNRWKIRLDMKDPQIEQLDKKIFMLTTLQAPEEGNLQQIHKVYLPESAYDAEISKDALGFTEIRFRQKTEGPRLFSLMTLGLLLMASGTILFFMRWKKGRFPAKKRND